MKRIFCSIFIIILASCQQAVKENPIADAQPEPKPTKKKTYPQIDTTRVENGDTYYQFIRATDSTSFIKWGNKSVSNISSQPHDNWYLDERIGLKLANEKFVVLDRSLGSDGWMHIVMPLTKESDTKIYQNPMAIDINDGVIVCEWYAESDTALLAENIMSGQKQAFGKDWKKCGAASFVHYCIDSISVSNKKLYVEWVTPNKSDAPNKKEIKRVKLDL